MKKWFNNVEEKAIHGIFAAGLGILLFYIRNNWHCTSMIAGVSFEVLNIMAFYMYLPFVLSLIYIVIFSYAKEVRRDRNQISVRTILLLGVTLLLAGYILFGLQEGVILIISVVFLIFRILRRV